MSVQGPFTAMDALYRWLDDDTDGFDAAITAYRALRSLSTAELPALTTIHKWWDPGSRITTTTPALMLVWESVSGEQGVNSRMYDHAFGLALLVASPDVTAVAGDTPEGGVLRACAQYAEALTDLFRRRSSPDAWTLGNGEGSLAEGRVIRATLDGIELRALGGDPTFPGAMLLGRVTVRLALDY